MYCIFLRDYLLLYGTVRYITFYTISIPLSLFFLCLYHTHSAFFSLYLSLYLLHFFSLTFSIAQNELVITQTDLLAAEDIVKEQICTESTLHIQGSDLQDQVQSRRNDIDNLLEKVSR